MIIIMVVVKVMAVMMIDTSFPPPIDYQKTVSSVKALFLYKLSPPAKEASVHDPEVKHHVKGNCFPCFHVVGYLEHLSNCLMPSVFWRSVETEEQKTSTTTRLSRKYFWSEPTFSTKSASRWSLFTIHRFSQAFLICFPNPQSNCQQGRERFWTQHVVSNRSVSGEWKQCNLGQI